MDYVSFSNVYPESLLKIGEDHFEIQKCPVANFAKREKRWPGVGRGGTQVSFAICSVSDPRSPFSLSLTLLMCEMRASPSQGPLPASRLYVPI